MVTSAASLSALMPPAPRKYRIHMACVPGGNVMAKVMGVPFFFASSTKGLSILGSAPTFFLSSDFTVMACPLRLSIQGITMGTLGAPMSPRVEAMGMPISMCVAWMSPLEIASRTAAQLACFTTVELMPYFLKNPFSCAMTMGEQSVSAMMPKRMSATSGVSAEPDDAGLGLDVEALASDLQPPSRTEAPRLAVAPQTKLRRSMGFSSLLWVESLPFFILHAPSWRRHHGRRRLRSRFELPRDLFPSTISRVSLGTRGAECCCTVSRQCRSRGRRDRTRDQKATGRSIWTMFSLRGSVSGLSMPCA
jgi:hypothetical protein